MGQVEDKDAGKSKYNRIYEHRVLFVKELVLISLNFSWIHSLKFGQWFQLFISNGFWLKYDFAGVANHLFFSLSHII